MMEKYPNSSEKIPPDLSNYFLSLSTDEFRDKLRLLRNEPTLKINIDLSDSDKDSFIILTRRLKSFVENGTTSQKRDATVHMKREQTSWEPNVFSSGVLSEYID